MRVFHKNYLLYCILLILTLCITGCQKAPKRDKDTTEKVDLSSDKLVPVQEAKRQTLKLQGINMDGLQFPKMIMFPDVQEISEIKLTPWYTQNDNDLKKVHRLVEHICPALMRPLPIQNYIFSHSYQLMAQVHLPMNFHRKIP